MGGKNYYVVLGVPEDEPQHGIRSAFRDLARRYHPDRAGGGSTRWFQEIVEAYEVLADDRRRAAYDRGLHHASTPGAAVRSGVSARPARPPRAEAEPLRTGRRHRDAEPLAPMHDPLMTGLHADVPGAAEMGRRFRQRPASLEPVDVQLHIDRRRALRGGTATLEVPVLYPCVRCHGAGGTLGIPCDVCGGEGMVAEPTAVRIRVPPMVESGTILEAPLRGAGVHNLFLRARVVIDDPTDHAP